MLCLISRSIILCLMSTSIVLSLTSASIILCLMSMHRILCVTSCLSSDGRELMSYVIMHSLPRTFTTISCVMCISESTCAQFLFEVHERHEVGSPMCVSLYLRVYILFRKLF